MPFLPPFLFSRPMNLVASADLCSRWRFRCRELKKKKSEEKKKGERKTSEAGRNVNCRADRGWRVNTASTREPRCAPKKRKMENGKRGRGREGGKKEMQERVVKELLTVDPIPLFRRADWSRERICAMRSGYGCLRWAGRAFHRQASRLSKKKDKKKEKTCA